LSGKHLTGGQTQILNVGRIRRINRHPVESDEDRTPETNSDTDIQLYWNQEFDNRNDSEDDCGADIESDIQQDYSNEDLDSPEQQDVSAAPYCPRLIRPTRKSKRLYEMVLMTVNAIETRRNRGVMKK